MDSNHYQYHTRRCWKRYEPQDIFRRPNVVIGHWTISSHKELLFIINGISWTSWNDCKSGQNMWLPPLKCSPNRLKSHQINPIGVCGTTFRLWEDYSETIFVVKWLNNLFNSDFMEPSTDPPLSISPQWIAGFLGSQQPAQIWPKIE